MLSNYTKNDFAGFQFKMSHIKADFDRLRQSLQVEKAAEFTVVADRQFLLKNKIGEIRPGAQDQDCIGNIEFWTPTIFDQDLN